MIIITSTTLTRGGEKPPHTAGLGALDTELLHDARARALGAAVAGARFRRLDDLPQHGGDAARAGHRAFRRRRDRGVPAGDLGELRGPVAGVADQDARRGRRRRGAVLGAWRPRADRGGRYAVRIRRFDFAVYRVSPPPLPSSPPSVYLSIYLLAWLGLCRGGQIRKTADILEVVLVHGLM